MRILVLHGPNLNLLGQREPEVYGRWTLAEIDETLVDEAHKSNTELRIMQSNHEGALIDAIHGARDDCAGIVVNPAAYSHTSVAIADALRSVALPVAEVHLSNIHAREQFRRHSYVSEVADVVIAGAGARGYEFAVRYLLDKLG